MGVGSNKNGSLGTTVILRIYHEPDVVAHTFTNFSTNPHLLCKVGVIQNAYLSYRGRK